MLQFTDRGIYCPQADVFIDPWKPVSKALITHSHSDHARYGHGQYLAEPTNEKILRMRLGQEINFQGIEYGKSVTINGVSISFHPAGHIPGSAQIRLEHGGEIWVVSGDYKLSNDGVSAPFEPVRCNHFITESTFGLPVYRFPEPQFVHNEINQWWQENAAQGKNSLVAAYSLGKAQRVLHHLDRSIGLVYLHGAVAGMQDILEQGHPFLRVPLTKEKIKGAMIVAPPSVIGSPWMKRFEPCETSMASGWMHIRGMKRRQNLDKGFVLSDHADWDQLLQAIDATGAENIYATHGYSAVLAQYLRESRSLNAEVIETLFDGDEEEVNGV